MGKGQSKPNIHAGKSEEEFVNKLIVSFENIKKDLPEVLKNLEKMKKTLAKSPAAPDLDSGPGKVAASAPESTGLPEASPPSAIPAAPPLVGPSPNMPNMPKLPTGGGTRKHSAKRSKSSGKQTRVNLQANNQE